MEHHSKFEMISVNENIVWIQLLKVRAQRSGQPVKEFGPKWPCQLAITNDGTYKGPELESPTLFYIKKKKNFSPFSVILEAGTSYPTMWSKYQMGARLSRPCLSGSHSKTLREAKPAL